MRAWLDKLKQPKNKYSLEQLKYLYAILIKNPIINEQNKSIVIESLRQLAELLIWGDQHNAGIIDYFLEKNILGFFLNILDQTTSKTVKVQLIQTLSILVENIRSQASIYYLFSNNYINELIIHKFDFSDEEVLAYYVSFLKCISLKLDKSTIQFFFNENENDFPLYTEAIKFFNHEESMVRIAVRTLTLNVYRVEDEAMRRYILNSTAVPYFSNIVWFMRRQCLILDKMVTSSSHDTRRKLDDYVAEMQDHFYYLHDIFNLGIASMNDVLTEHMIKNLLIPVFVGALVDNSSKPQTDPVSAEENKNEDRVSAVLALYLLAQVFTVFSHKDLLNTLAASIIHPNPARYSALVKAKQLPPPPLEGLTKRRAHYSNFRRFNSVPNLELLESQSHRSVSAPASPSTSRSFVGSLSFRGGSGNAAAKAGTSAPTPVDLVPDPAPPLARVESEPVGSESAKSNPMSIPPSPHMMAVSVESNASVDSDSEAVTPMSLEVEMDPASEVFDEGNSCREALLGFFGDDRTASNALCLLYSMIKNPEIEKELLEVGGLLPYRLSKAKYLLDILTAPGASEMIPSSVPMKQFMNRHETQHIRSKSDSSAINLVQDAQPALHRPSLLLLPPKPASNTPTSSPLPLPTSQTNQNPNQQENASTGPRPTTPPPTTTTTSASEAVVVYQQQQPPSSPPLSPTSAARTQRPFVGVELGDSFVPLPDNFQTSFSRRLISELLHILIRSDQFRLVTLQMTLIIFKELVYSPDSPPRLTERQLDLLEEAAATIALSLQARLTGVLGDIFLEFFEEELRNYKHINYDYLVKDSTLLLPVSGTPMSRLDLSKRLPSGEAELTQRAIQQFLVLRELKFTLLKKKDDLLPLKQTTMPTLFPKDVFTPEPGEIYTTIPCTALIGPNRKRVKRVIVLYHQMLMVLESSTTVPMRAAGGSVSVVGASGVTAAGAGAGRQSFPPPSGVAPAVAGGAASAGTAAAEETKDGSAKDFRHTSPPKSHPFSGIVVHGAPLQTIVIETDHTQHSVLNISSHETTWKLELSFEDDGKCLAAKELLLKARSEVRARKMAQIYALLGQRDPLDLDRSGDTSPRGNLTTTTTTSTSPQQLNLNPKQENPQKDEIVGSDPLNAIPMSTAMTTAPPAIDLASEEISESSSINEGVDDDDSASLKVSETNEAPAAVTFGEENIKSEPEKEANSGEYLKEKREGGGDLVDSDNQTVDTHEGQHQHTENGNGGGIKAELESDRAGNDNGDAVTYSNGAAGHDGQQQEEALQNGEIDDSDNDENDEDVGARIFGDDASEDESGHQDIVKKIVFSDENGSERVQPEEAV